MKTRNNKGQFVKGCISPRKGVVLSEQTKNKISISRKGIGHTEETKKKISQNAAKFWLGKKMPLEMREKFRLAKLGKPRAGDPKNWKRSEETRKKLSEATKAQGLHGVYLVKWIKENGSWNKGKKAPQISEAKMGSKNPMWRGGVTEENNGARATTKNKKWKERIKILFDNRCFDCGRKNGEDGVENLAMHVDHIYPFSLYPRLRFMLENGRVLCINCHKKTPSWGRTMKKQIEQYAKTK